MPRYPVLSFNAGELSPQIDARSDIDKYQSGCRTLQNMIPRIYGTAERRPGTKYIDTCNGVSRVIPFVYSNAIAYIVLLEDLRMYFYFDGGRVLDAEGRRHLVDTPYLAADLPQIQFKQSNDVMWLVHPDYAPRKLSRVSANKFTLDAIVFEKGPFKTRNDVANDDDITLAPSVTTGSGNLTSSAAVFASGHVGALFSIIQPRVNTEVAGSKTNPATGVIGSTLLVEGSFTFTTHGTWTGTVKLERSIDGSAWETMRSWTGSADTQVQYTGDEIEDDILYRINVTSMSANTAPGTTGTPSKIEAQLTVNSSTQEGICRVTAFVTDQQVSMTVLKNFASTNADVRWKEGSWSTYRGFPTTVTFFENRCVYAGTPHQPQTVWLSATGDFENFYACTKDDSPFSLTMSSDTRNAIQWISALEALIVGTTGGEWRIRSSSFDEPLTPSNFSFKQQTTYGSKALQAWPTNDVILFVDFVGRKVREATYSGDKDKYVAPDLTALAEHITLSGITGMAYQKNPDPMLWCTLANGNLISMTYEREQNVVAWAVHPFETGDGVISGTPDIPAVPGTYTYIIVGENGDIWGIPVTDRVMLNLDVGGEARNIGSGRVGIPYHNNPFAEGHTVTITGTTNYNGNFVLQEGTSTSEMVILDTYVAETFDGTETVARRIATSASAGRLVVDSTGPPPNIWFGHNFASSTIVTKIEADETLVTDGLTWPTVLVAGDQCTGLAMTANKQQLYVLLKGTARGEVIKFDLSTGAALWNDATLGSNSGYDLAIDAAGNAYTAVAGNGIEQFASADGARTILTNMGEAGDALIVEAIFATLVDDDMGIVIGGGHMYCGTAAYPAKQALMYNLCVRKFDDSAGAQLKVGTPYIDGALTRLPTIGTGNIVTSDPYIFVLANDVLHKIEWDSDASKLTIIKSVSTATNSCGLMLDLWGNVVVVNQSSPAPYQDDVLWYYDQDLAYLSKNEGMASGMLNTWNAAIGGAWIGGIGFANGTLGTPLIPGTPDREAEGLGPNSVAVIPAEDEDEVWVIVYRTVGGKEARYLEQMQPRVVEDQEDLWFVDSGLDYDGDPDTTFSGLDHLEGEELKVLADGAIQPPVTVTSGAITISEAASRVIVGLRFRYTLKPMRFDLALGGGTKGTLKKFAEVVLSFYKTLNAKYGVDASNLFEIDWRTEEAYGSPPVLYTGDKPVVHEGGWDPEDSIIISGDDPFPCVVRAIVPRIEGLGR
jgi:hypothetical protein